MFYLLIENTVSYVINTFTNPKTVADSVTLAFFAYTSPRFAPPVTHRNLLASYIFRKGQ